MDAFELARKIAAKSEPIVTKYQHSSVILDRKGRVISTGRNHFVGTIISSDEGTNINRTVHSEIHALRNVNIRKLDDAVIVNFARTRANTIKARPCINCWLVLRKLGFRKVYYSTSNNTWREEYF